MPAGRCLFIPFLITKSQKRQTKNRSSKKSHQKRPTGLINCYILRLRAIKHTSLELTRRSESMYCASNSAAVLAGSPDFDCPGAPPATLKYTCKLKMDPQEQLYVRLAKKLQSNDPPPPFPTAQLLLIVLTGSPIWWISISHTSRIPFSGFC